MVAYDNSNKDNLNSNNGMLEAGFNDGFKTTNSESTTDYINTNPENIDTNNNVDTNNNIDTINNVDKSNKPITLSSILEKHKEKQGFFTPSLDKLSSLLKSSEGKETLPYTNYIIGGTIFLLICMGLYYIYVYFVENKIINKVNKYLKSLNPSEKKNSTEEKEKTEKNKKKTNYKKEGFENNIKGLDKAINGKVNKNSLNSDVNVFNSDFDSDSDNQISDDIASSSTQIGFTKDKHCYIGTDRGFRSCIEIGDADKCMSGDIFPTHDKCINPSLR